MRRGWSEVRRGDGVRCEEGLGEGFHGFGRGEVDG